MRIRPLLELMLQGEVEHADAVDAKELTIEGEKTTLSNPAFQHVTDDRSDIEELH